MLWFNELNRGKTGIALDLSHPQGADIFRRLAAISDVVIDNFSARVMPNLGLDYDRLRSVNPSIISVSISGYGATGPWANWIASGPSIDSANGMAWLTGYPGRGTAAPGQFQPRHRRRPHGRLHDRGCPRAPRPDRLGAEDRPVDGGERGALPR